MHLNKVFIEDDFAEAFAMKATRILITARSAYWAEQAAFAATGFATSVIACGCEAGIEKILSPAETPDGRPGIALLFFAMSSKELCKQLERRIGQCVLTCPGTAVYSGCDTVPASTTATAATVSFVPLGDALRYFADGYQIAKRIGDRRFWRLPVMDGEFLCEDRAPIIKAIGGGNFFIMAENAQAADHAAQVAMNAMRGLDGVIFPFPGGVVRSGSKVGSKYPRLPASTNDAYCPGLRNRVASKLQPGERAVLEIVIDGLNTECIERAMFVGITAACAQPAILRIAAGNYGGKLGEFHFYLQPILRGSS